MRFLATLCNCEVSGSDLTMGGHSAKNVHGADLVVYSAAVAEDNPELIEARRLGIKTIVRSEFLGELSRGYKKVIAIAGTHGKTTVSALLTEALWDLNPTAAYGGSVNGSIGRKGGNEIFIAEACEYKRSFLSLYPDISIITSIDLDHTDCYSSLGQVYSAFSTFCGQSKVVFACGDNCARELNPDFTYGLSKECDYMGKVVGKDGYFVLFVYFRGTEIWHGKLRLKGAHNIQNAVAAVAVSHYLKQNPDRISFFNGVDRRFEYLGSREGVHIYSDYAHHPAEIICTVQTALSLYDRVLVIFEPHTYSRTSVFYEWFAKELGKATDCIVLPIFAAREKPIYGVSSSMIADEGNFYLAKDYADAENNIRLKEYDAIIFMGAGSIDNLARKYAEGR